MSTFRHLIAGRLEDSASSFEIINPSTGEAFARCPSATTQQLEDAVEGARAAFPSWRSLSYEDRRTALRGFGDAVLDRIEPIARTLVLEQGKPFAQAQFEVREFAHHMETMCQWEPASAVLRQSPRRIELRHVPIGVVGAITPWNVPLILASHKIAHALFAGNTMVLKPSPYTPLSTLLLGEAAIGALPAGVLNILAGGNDLGRWMTEHPGIDRITFTGSVSTGKRVMESAASSLKRVTLELGGNDPAIVLDDADLEKTAAGIFRAAFWNSGQVCMAAKRVFAAPSIYAPLVERLSEMARDHKVGDGFEPGVGMGPLQNKMQFEKVVDLLSETKADSRARITAGGYTLNRSGYFVVPTIVADAEDDMRLVREEQFGPILPILRFSEIDEVVGRANATSMGLCASVWTENIELGYDIAGRLEAGTIWVNHHLESLFDVPFGGFKASGIGRELGEAGMLSYMEAQVINIPG